MQVKTLDLLYDVFSDVLFNLTRFDTEKEIYTFHTKLLKMPNLCYIRSDEQVHLIRDHSTVWKCVNFLKTNCWYLLFPESLNFFPS